MKTAPVSGGAHIQPRVKESGKLRSAGPERRTDRGQDQPLVFTTTMAVAAAGQNWLTAPAADWTLAGKSPAALAQKRDLLFGASVKTKERAGAKVEQNGLHHDKTSHFQLH